MMSVTSGTGRISILVSTSPSMARTFTFTAVTCGLRLASFPGAHEKKGRSAWDTGGVVIDVCVLLKHYLRTTATHSLAPGLPPFTENENGFNGLAPRLPPFISLSLSLSLPLGVHEERGHRAKLSGSSTVRPLHGVT